MDSELKFLYLFNLFICVLRINFSIIINPNASINPTIIGMIVSKRLIKYVNLFNERDDVFAIMFDAQRRVRLENSRFKKIEIGNDIFAVEEGRGIPGAGDCLYSREVLNAVGGWHVGLQNNAEEIFTEIFTEKGTENHSRNLARRSRHSRGD